MSEGKLASGMVNGLLHGKNSIESHVQAGILLRSQDSTLVREKSEGSFAGSPQLSQDQPALSPSPHSLMVPVWNIWLMSPRQLWAPVVISSLSARLVWKR